MNIIVNKIIKYSFQEPSFCYIDTREGWNQLRKILGLQGNWGKLWGIGGEQKNRSGKRNLGKGKEKGLVNVEGPCWGMRREDADWWGDGHCLNQSFLLGGIASNWGCRLMARKQSPSNWALQGFHPRFWSLHFMDEPTKGTKQLQMFCLYQKSSHGFSDDISLSIKCWELNGDTLWSTWNLYLERQFLSVMV